MADCADLATPYINEIVVAGQERIQRELATRKVYPIVLMNGSERYGVCHWCEAPIIPGYLFCPKDPQDDGKSCSEMHDHEQQRLKAHGSE